MVGNEHMNPESRGVEQSVERGLETVNFPVLGGDWGMCTPIPGKVYPGRCSGEGGEVGTPKTMLSGGR